MDENWMDELYRMHEEDKSKQETKKKVAPLDLSILSQNRIELAAATLRSVNAHAVMRRLQSALLGGKGVVDTFDSKGDYDRIITLAWQGTFSTARKPDPQTSEEYWYISVGAKGKRLYVNDKEVTPITPEAFKAALVKASKNPGRTQPKDDASN